MAMASTIPNLWPDEIKTSVLTPLAILRYQAAQIGNATKGLLEAEVSTANSENKQTVTHQLDLVAPVLRGYRHRVLTVRHNVEMVYPVTVQADAFLPERSCVDLAAMVSVAAMVRQPRLEDEEEAATEEEFIALVRKALAARRTKSLIQSLIARSNEFKSSAPAA